MINTLTKQESRLRIFSWILFLLPALALTTHFGIGVIEATFILGAMYYAKPLWLQRKEFFQSAKWIVIAFAFNLAVVLMSLAWSGFNFSELDNPIRQLLATAAIGLIVLTKPKAEWFWYGLFVGVIGAACLALYQRFGLHWPRAGGFHQIIMFGDIAMAMGLMSLASIQRFAKTRLAILPYIAFLAGLAASILSGSRGGWIALVLSFIPLYSYGRRTVGSKILAVALLGASLIAGACFVPQLGVSQRLVAIANDIHQYQIGNPLTSAGARFELWKGAWKMFSEHPVAGVGRTNFIPGLTELISRGEIHPSVQEYNHAHNEMFHALATQGMVGAIALLLLYGAPFVFFIRSLRRDDACQPYALAGLLLVLSFVDFGLTQVLFAHHVGTAFYALTVSVLTGICVMTQQSNQTSKSKHR